MHGLRTIRQPNFHKFSQFSQFSQFFTISLAFLQGRVSFLLRLGAAFPDHASVACVSMYAHRPVIMAMKLSGMARSNASFIVIEDHIAAESLTKVGNMFELFATAVIVTISSRRDVSGLLGDVLEKHDNSSKSISTKDIAHILERKDAQGQNLLQIALKHAQKEFIGTARVQEYVNRRLWRGEQALFGGKKCEQALPPFCTALVRFPFLTAVVCAWQQTQRLGRGLLSLC